MFLQWKIEYAENAMKNYEHNLWQAPYYQGNNKAIYM